VLTMAGPGIRGGASSANLFLPGTVLQADQFTQRRGRRSGRLVTSFPYRGSPS
jgi:hypothetical protein